MNRLVDTSAIDLTREGLFFCPKEALTANFLSFQGDPVGTLGALALLEQGDIMAYYRNLELRIWWGRGGVIPAKSITTDSATDPEGFSTEAERLTREISKRAYFADAITAARCHYAQMVAGVSPAM